MKAIVLSGGLGTRLRPLSCSTPKALLPLLNRPFLEYQLDLLQRHRIRDVVFCLNYKPQLFKRYFKERYWIPDTGCRMKVDYVIEKNPLGTGGAVRNAFGKKKIDESIMIFNGDVLTDIDLNKLISFHREKKAKITITLAPVKDPSLYGLVETTEDGRITQFIEKPSLPITLRLRSGQAYHPLPISCTINAGIYIFEPSILDFIPSGVNYSLERGLFPLVLAKGFPMYGYIHNGYWLDIGTVEKYLQANFDLMNRKVKGVKLKVKSFKRITDNRKRTTGKLITGEKTKISKSVQILGNMCIGKNCSVGKNVILRDSIILDHTYIGEGVKIEGSVICSHCRIEENTTLNPGTVLGDGSVVKKYSRV